MIACHSMSDRMPEATRGGVRWTAAEERHLACCDACRLEWDLVRRITRLGADVDLALDPAAIAGRVLGRLRTAEVAASRHRAWVVGAFATAAGIVVLLWGRTASDPPRSVVAARESVAVARSSPAFPAAGMLASVDTVQADFPVPELDGLNADQLRMVMESLDRPFRPDELLESPGDLESRALDAGFSS